MGNRGEHPFASRWNHNTHHFPRLAARVPLNAARLLDIGCGEGTFCRFVADDRRAVLGLDSDQFVLPIPTPAVWYVAGSAAALPFRDASFDAVTRTMVLHHVRAEHALSEAARVRDLGGFLLVLGYGRYGGPRDLLHEIRDALAHRVVARKM